MTSIVHELRAWQRRRALPKVRREGALAAMLRTQTVFVHVPKCAGKAVIRTLYGLDTHDWFGHASLPFYRALLGPARFDRFRKFAVLRDPADRCRSAYHFARQGGFGLDNDIALHALLAGTEFDSFVQGGQLEALIGRFVIFRPQHRFVCDTTGAPGLDFICRQETLEQDLRRECAGLIKGDGMVQENRSDYHRDADIDPRTRARLAEIYAQDVALIARYKAATDRGPGA